MNGRTEAGVVLHATFIRQIREQLDAHDWSTRRLARVMETSPSTLYTILRGEHVPTLETVARAAAALGCTVELRFVPDV